MIQTKKIITLWLSKIVLKCAANNVKISFRKLEATQKKLVSLEEHREFNQQYIYIY